MGQDSFSSVFRQIKDIILYTLYLIFHLTLENSKKAYNFIIGEKKQKGKVLVSRILYKNKLVPDIAKRQDFVTSGGQWMDLDMLDNPFWGLYCVEKDRAYFVFLPHSINYYNVTNFPFMGDGMHDEALAVAEVLKYDFLQLGKKFDERPHAKTVFFSNTPRCGTTLMAKMLDHPGYSVCFGEPHAICNMTVAAGEGTMSDKIIADLLSATVSCLRAHVPINQVCVLKCGGADGILVPICEKIDMKHIFMTRKKGLLSVEKMLRYDEFTTSFLLNFYRLSPFLCRWYNQLTCFAGQWIRKLKPTNLRMQAAIVYADSYSSYLANQKYYCHPVIWYHDLLEDTANVLKELFAKIEISPDCVNAAVACKNDDSQKNSNLSWDALKHIKLSPLTNEDRLELREYARQMGVPEGTFE